MRLKLLSDGFSIDTGTLGVKLAAELGPSSSRATVAANSVEGLAVTDEGVYRLEFFECSVTLRNSGEIRSVPYFSVDATLSKAALDVGKWKVHLGRLALVRITAIDGRRQPLRSPSIGVVFPHVTVERESKGGRLDVLLPPGGPYLAYLSRRPSLRARFEVLPDQVDGDVFLVDATDDEGL